MKRIQKNLLKSACALSVLTLSLNALASEGFKAHYTPASLSGETTISQEDRPGFFGSFYVTGFNVSQVSDTNGNNGPVVNVTPAQLAAYVPAYSSYFNALGTSAGGLPPLTSAAVTETVTQSQSQANLIAGYITSEKYMGGNLIAAINIPLITSTRSVTASVDSATLAKAASQGTTAVIVGTANAVAAARSGSAGGLGDIELTGAWSRFNGTNMKYIAGLTLVAPTGSFDPNMPVNLGYGYYTIKPSVAAIYHEKSWSFGGRASYGYNTVNSSSNYQSGNYVAFELSGAYKLPHVSVGLNVTQFNQISDDSYSGNLNAIGLAGNSATTSLNGVNVPIDGGQRTSYTAISPFVAIPLRESGSLITLSYLTTPNASDSMLIKSYLQFRWTQVFK